MYIFLGLEDLELNNTALEVRIRYHHDGKPRLYAVLFMVLALSIGITITESPQMATGLVTEDNSVLAIDHTLLLLIVILGCLGCVFALAPPRAPRSDRALMGAYIGQMRDLDFSDSFTRNRLISAGWIPELVDIEFSKIKM